MSWNGAERRHLPAPVRLFLYINIVLGILALIFVGVCRYSLHLPAPYRTPFMPFPPYYDLRAYYYRFPYFHQLAFFSHNPNLGAFFEYPAPVSLFYWVLYRTQHHLQLFVASAGVPFAIAIALYLRDLIKKGVDPIIAIVFTLLTLVFSYPFWFEYRLGNMEMYVFLLVIAGVALYFRQHFFPAAILIGIATSMKIFPGVYFAPFLSRKQYKQMAVGLVAALASNLLSLWVLGPSIRIAARGIQEGLALNREHYMLHFLPVETGFDHSMFGLIKRIFFKTGTGEVPSSVLSIYLPVVAIAGLLLYFLRLRYLPLTNQIVCLCVVSILLPPTSHDYTLIHLYLPLAILVSYSISSNDMARSYRGLIAIFACLAVLVSPEPEAIHSGAAFSAQIKCLFLVLLLALASWNKLPDPALDGTTQTSNPAPTEERATA